MLLCVWSCASQHSNPAKYHQKHRRVTPRSKPARKPKREPASLPHHATREDEETSTVTESSEEEGAAGHKQRVKAKECEW